MIKTTFGKRNKTRKIIMDAAMDLFEAHEIKNVTFSDIAEAAGVSRTTVFNYFANQNELLAALCEQEMIDIEEYCLKQEKECGYRDVRHIFDQLVYDLALYPHLLAEITYSTILYRCDYNPVKNVEMMILERVHDEEKTVVLLGAFYGIMNHYFVNNKKFDEDELKEKMHRYIDAILND